MKFIRFLALGCSALLLAQCSKKDDPGSTPVQPQSITITSSSVASARGSGEDFTLTPVSPALRLVFSGKIRQTTLLSSITWVDGNNQRMAFNASVESDSIVTIRPNFTFPSFNQTRLIVATSLESSSGGRLNREYVFNLRTGLDFSRKLPAISDDSLMSLVQRRTFAYFWDFGHPTSGLNRERNSSGDLVTSGGSGFGAMAIVTGVNRGFITRSQGAQRLATMVNFLTTRVSRYHGAFPHWFNGSTGATIPFSTKDNGADLVETSLLMQGLLIARQYFNGTDATEATLRNQITTLYNEVEWNWFRKSAENQLYWHWSPNYGWDINLAIKGWSECLITYVLAAGSPQYSIPATVYQQGWKGSSTYINGNTYFGVNLPLGPNLGGPLFFAHYSFLGMNPNGLQEGGYNFLTQNTRHTQVNQAYCVANPGGKYGYSDSCWGLTASDIPGGYSASSPTNDLGVITPAAALGSMPYTPAESMKALRFFYYVLGDKLLGDYGFYDAFKLEDGWFANSTLAIDQGPILIMMENQRTGLLWNLGAQVPEIKAGLTKLGFTAPYL